METLSDTDPWYAALEAKIQQMPGMKSRVAQRESVLLQKFLSANEVESMLAVIPGSQIPVEALVDGTMLPTRFDDFVSFRIMDQLMRSVRTAAHSLGLDDSAFGGFCFAPTGAVGAQSIPVALAGQPSRVFVVFESGLFAFVDGVIRTLVAAVPKDFLEGDGPAAWMLAWNRAEEGSDRERDGKDLFRWLSYYKDPASHDGLTYVPMSEFGPNGIRLIHDMVFGAELFIAAHEFAHVVKSHHRATEQSDHEIELIADILGTNILLAALGGTRVNRRFALVGVRIFLRCLRESGGYDHLHPDEQLRFLAIARAAELAGCFDQTDWDLANAFVTCFDELASIGRERQAD